MKKNITAILIVIFLIGSTNPAVSAGKKKRSIHPSFKSLLINYPREKPIVNPEIARISAKTAFNYYRSQKAIFIAAGQMAIKASLPGAIPLTKIKNPDALKKFKDKLIIIFCH